MSTSTHASVRRDSYTIPLRITRNCEQPVSRTFWFDTIFTSPTQSLNDLLRSYLRDNHIDFVSIYGQVWFFFREEWCRCEFEASGMDVKVFLLQYIQN